MPNKPMNWKELFDKEAKKLGIGGLARIWFKT